MSRRPVAVRTISVLLAFLLGLSGPAAAFAHGVAHVREHVGAVPHGTDAPHHGFDDGFDDASVAPVDGTGDDAVHEAAHAADAADAGRVAGRSATGETASHATLGTHAHARVGAQVVQRLDADVLLPSAPVLLVVARVIATPVVLAAAPSPDRPARLAGPPPASRAPPPG